MATHEYGYNSTRQYESYLELEDNLNFALEAYDADGLAYYLVVYTKLGETITLEWGPLSCDDEILPEEYTIKYQKFEVDADEVDDMICKFLQARKRLKSHMKNPFDYSRRCKIEDVKQVTIDYALSQGVDAFKYLDVTINGRKEDD